MSKKKAEKKPAKKKENRDQVLQIRLSEDEVRKLKAIGKQNGLSMAGVLRTILYDAHPIFKNPLKAE